MDWVENANAIMTLIGTLIGLLTGGIPLVILVINIFKNKNKQEVLNIITEIVKSAVAQAEKSGKSGADKKTMAKEIAVEALKSQGIDASAYADQVEAAIESLVKTVNIIVK